jgi:hypothetical protein
MRVGDAYLASAVSGNRFTPMLRLVYATQRRRVQTLAPGIFPSGSGVPCSQQLKSILLERADEARAVSPRGFEEFNLPPMEVCDQSKESFPLMVWCRSLPIALLFPKGEHRIDRSSAACRNKPGNCGTYSEDNRSPGICKWIVPANSVEHAGH